MWAKQQTPFIAAWLLYKIGLSNGSEFNPDPTMQARVIFSKTLHYQRYPPLSFNYHQTVADNSHKHLGKILDGKLTLAEHA